MAADRVHAAGGLILLLEPRDSRDHERTSGAVGEEDVEEPAGRHLLLESSDMPDFRGETRSLNKNDPALVVRAARGKLMIGQMRGMRSMLEPPSCFDSSSWG